MPVFKKYTRHKPAIYLYIDTISVQLIKLTMQGTLHLLSVFAVRLNLNYGS